MAAGYAALMQDLRNYSLNGRRWEKQKWLPVPPNFGNAKLSDISCRDFWRVWGQNVRSSSFYALSKECEELAVQVRIQFVRNSPHV